MRDKATHPVKIYGFFIEGVAPIECLRARTLRTTIKQLLNCGRVVISANWEGAPPCAGFWTFETVYIGRKAVQRKGVRHRLRAAHRKFNPYVIPIWSRGE